MPAKKILGRLLKIGVPGGTRTQNDLSAFVRLDLVRQIPKRRVAKDIPPASLVSLDIRC
jgi:hypothetical protein